MQVPCQHNLLSGIYIVNPEKITMHQGCHKQAHPAIYQGAPKMPRLRKFLQTFYQRFWYHCSYANDAIETET